MTGNDARNLIAVLLRQTLEGGSKVEIDGLVRSSPEPAIAFALSRN